VPLAIGVLQVLSLDIATDLLPALALGAEPASPRVLDGPPPRRRLIDGAVLRRALLVLGPVEATIAMVAFLAVLVSGGWTFGATVPAATLATASGAAFTAVVLGQMANAFACRSSSRPPWRIGWRSNPLLVWAVGIELLVLVAMLGVPSVASLLGHRPPTLFGLALAAAAVPAVLAVDALVKAAATRRRGAPRTGSRSPSPLRPAAAEPPGISGS
jgi:magnesium-transporting ATPase (P-type)